MEGKKKGTGGVRGGLSVGRQAPWAGEPVGGASVVVVSLRLIRKAVPVRIFFYDGGGPDEWARFSQLPAQALRFFPDYLFFFVFKVWQ